MGQSFKHSLSSIFAAAEVAAVDPFGAKGQGNPDSLAFLAEAMKRSATLPTGYQWEGRFG